jgi:hypothetical protein
MAAKGQSAEYPPSSMARASSAVPGQVSPGCAWRLWLAGHRQGRAQASGLPATATGARADYLQGADSTALDPAGPVSAAREEQLRSLLSQRDAGLVVGEKYAAQRRAIIHAEE